MEYSPPKDDVLNAVGNWRGAARKTSKRKIGKIFFKNSILFKKIVRISPGLKNIDHLINL